MLHFGHQGQKHSQGTPKLACNKIMGVRVSPAGSKWQGPLRVGGAEPFLVVVRNLEIDLSTTTEFIKTKAEETRCPTL